MSESNQHSERDEALWLARSYDDGSLIPSTNGATKVARAFLDLVEQLEATQRERDSLVARLRAQGYNVTEILAFDASNPASEPETFNETTEAAIRREWDADSNQEGRPE